MADALVVYGSQRSLYVATQKWIDPRTSLSSIPPSQSTVIDEFDATSPVHTTYVASGEVPGFVLNQFSMSEYGGYMRVATTSRPIWWGSTAVCCWSSITASTCWSPARGRSGSYRPAARSCACSRRAASRWRWRASGSGGCPPGGARSGRGDGSRGAGGGIRAALDWSCELLSEPERVLLRRLSVFVGGVDPEAIEAVCSGGDLEAGCYLRPR